MIIQKELKELCHYYPVCKSLSLWCTSSLKSSGSPGLTEQTVACSELLLCLYVSTAMMIHLSRPQQTPVDQGSWPCYLAALALAWQNEFISAKQWLGSRRDPETCFALRHNLLTWVSHHSLISHQKHCISLGDGIW